MKFKSTCCCFFATVSVAQVAATLAWGSRGTSDYDRLRSSLIRIQAVSAGFEWLNPFAGGQDHVGIGSGFVVQTEPYPLFVTNAHVVNDASHVVMQLLLFGEHQWEAQVVSICSKFDLALLVLRDPSTFKATMDAQKIKLTTLKLHQGAAAMGQDVVALGFPLGSDSLKISKGNIAGNEDIDGNICIQSTAPISPGNSGGPLLDAEGMEVLGVNFAKATAGENINYVIPAWRVKQLVNKHLKDREGVVKADEMPRVHVQVPRADLTTIESNDALYKMSDGCSRGLHVARVGDRSFFKKAQPELLPGSFLVSVDGKELDSFGMGLNSEFVADRVDFSDLFFMLDNLDGDVAFKSCHRGKLIEHKVSMGWSPEYDRGIHFVDEPHMSGSNKKYELFTDISVTEMTVNHISAVLYKNRDPGPARWLHPDFVSKPKLIVNYVKPGSYASAVIPVGSAVSLMNGHEVNTLEEFQQHFIPKDESNIWTLQTDTGRLIAVMFNATLAEQLAQAKLMNSALFRTPSVVAAEKLGFGMIHPPSPRGSSVADSKAPAEKAIHMPSTPTRSADGQGTKSSSSFLSAARTLSPAQAVKAKGLDVTAAGPLLAVREIPGAPRTTRTDAMPNLWERV